MERETSSVILNNRKEYLIYVKKLVEQKRLKSLAFVKGLRQM